MPPFTPRSTSKSPYFSRIDALPSMRTLFGTPVSPSSMPTTHMTPESPEFVQPTPVMTADIAAQRERTASSLANIENNNPTQVRPQVPMFPAIEQQPNANLQAIKDLSVHQKSVEAIAEREATNAANREAMLAKMAARTPLTDKQISEMAAERKKRSSRFGGRKSKKKFSRKSKKNRKK